MRRVISSVVVLLILVAGLAACAPQAESVEQAAPAPVEEKSSEAEEADTAGQAEEPAAAEEEASAEPAVEVANPLKVVFLLPQTLSPFEIDMWNGIDQAKTDGIASEIKMIEMKEPTEFEQTIRQVSEEGYDVVVSAYFLVKEPFLKVAPDFPDTRYLLVYEAAPEEDNVNVQGIQYDVQEGSYVCGVVAAHATAVDQIGFIGGADYPGILKFLAGYEAGLKSVKPDINLDIAWAGTFTDPDKGHELGLALYERGDDIVMHAANKTGLGVFVAAEEEEKFAIGVDVDQTDLAPTSIICNALTNPGASVYKSLKDIAEGTWEPGNVNWGVDDGVPSVALNKILLTDEAVAAAEEAEAKIKSGEIEVPVSTETR